MIVDKGAAQGIFTAVAAGNEQSEGASLLNPCLVEFPGAELLLDFCRSLLRRRPSWESDRRWSWLSVRTPTLPESLHLLTLCSPPSGVADLPAYDATVIGGVNVKIPYLSPAPFNATVGKAYRLYFTSTNTSNPVDACSPLPAGLDLSGYVVVVQRGTCGFVVKYANVVAAGGLVSSPPSLMARRY